MTLKIIKNQANTLILTLSELANPSIPSNWLFVFTREQNNTVAGSLQLVDISAFTDRYNEFTLTEGVNDDIEFPNIGDYQYECYQMPDNTSVNPADGTRVEIGKVRVFDTDEEIIAYDAQITNKVYEY